MLDLSFAVLWILPLKLTLSSRPVLAERRGDGVNPDEKPLVVEGAVSNGKELGHLESPDRPYSCGTGRGKVQT